MCDHYAAGWRARLQRERPRLYVAGKLLLFAVAIAVFVTSLPPVGLLSAIPFSGLPDLPDLPGWLKWLWRSIMIAIVVLAVIGAVEKRRERERAERADRD